jgi:hypothetical protein
VPEVDPPRRARDEEPERPSRSRSRDDRPGDAVGLLPLGLLLQSVGHAITLLIPLGGLVILGATLEQGRVPGANGMDMIQALMGLGIVACIVASVILGLLAACHYTLATEAPRSRPLGLALLVLVCLQGMVVAAGLPRLADPDPFGRGPSMFVHLVMTGAWAVVGLEFVRLSLLGWYLRAAQVPRRDSGAGLLAVLTPMILLAPWVLLLGVAILTGGAGAGPGIGELLAITLGFLVFLAPVTVYIWSLVVLTRLRGQWLRADSPWR